MADYIQDVNSALKIAGWRTDDQLINMSTEDERNTLIVELHNHSNLSISQLQHKHNTGSLMSLTGMAAIYYFLNSNNIRSTSDLIAMSDHDQRNTLIVELNRKVNKEIKELQGMNDHELVACGVDFYRKDKTVAKVIAVNWDVTTAKIVDKTPELLGRQIFDNRNSSQVLKETFSYKKTITKETSFQHSQTVDFSSTVGYSFTAGVPGIAEVSGEVSVTLGSSTTWTNATKQSVSKEFTKTTPIEVNPGGYILRKSMLTVGRMDVPYTMEVEMQSGRKTTVDGIWHGVTMYNIQETQEDL